MLAGAPGLWRTAKDIAFLGFCFLFGKRMTLVTLNSSGCCEDYPTHYSPGWRAVWHTASTRVWAFVWLHLVSVALANTLKPDIAAAAPIPGCALWPALLTPTQPKTDARPCPPNVHSLHLVMIKPGHHQEEGGSWNHTSTEDVGTNEFPNPFPDPSWFLRAQSVHTEEAKGHRTHICPTEVWTWLGSPPSASSRWYKRAHLEQLVPILLPLYYR